MPAIGVPRINVGLLRELWEGKINVWLGQRWRGGRRTLIA